MLKIIFTLLLLFHGLIHLMGFAKAFEYGNITQLTKAISKPMGLLWLLAAILFMATLILWWSKTNSWLLAALVAVLLSQVLIFTSWGDAKFGTIANVLVLVVAGLNWGSLRFENTFRQDVQKNLLRGGASATEMLTESDLQPLPVPVQRYLRYAGVVGKPKVKNMRIVFEGEMRDKGKGWFPFRSVQYNFFDEPTRLFFMKGRMMGMTVPGYHCYSEAQATMDIRLFGWFPVNYQSGDLMNKTETVTLFNDMCLMAPASLIDSRIEWETVDSLSAKATFTNRGISISAILYFNQEGQLIDFLSNDRSAIAEGKTYPFSTPASAYQNINGVTVMTYGEAIWHYPEGKFTYGKFNLKEIEYNCTDFRTTPPPN
ncbi:MAG: hypothetical protein HUU01_08265 [Saprospiraceae bacterium]|nr:hypothetical protein [Saprospiraceae bacterium]